MFSLLQEDNSASPNEFEGPLCGSGKRVKREWRGKERNKTDEKMGE